MRLPVRVNVATLAFLLLLSGPLASQEARLGGEPPAGGPRRSPPRGAVADLGEGSYPRGLNAQAPAHPQQTTFTDADGYTHWKEDVNVGCSFSDHSYSLSITEDPEDLSDISYAMTNYDVDYGDPQGCPGGAEVDRMVWNGGFLGILTGANNSWSINSYSLSRDKMVNGTNTIFIDTDSTGTGCWCVGVGYVEVKAKVRFQVKKHDPQRDDKNRDFHAGKLNLTVEFTHEYEPSTLTASTFKLEYKDQGGARQQVAGNFQQVAPTTFKFTPTADLKGGVRYYATVKGGVNGVKKKNDTGQLPNDKTWEFWTVPDLDQSDPFARPPSSAAEPDPASSREALATACVPPTASPCSGVEVAVFQVDKNKTLVAGKRAATRVYLRWKKHTDVLATDQLEELTANVDMGAHGGARVESVKRQDKYSADDRKKAKNTVNFFDTPNGDYTYKADVEPRPQSNATPVTFTKTNALASKATQSMSFRHYFLKDADWSGGVPLLERVNGLLLFLTGPTFVKSQFPVTAVSPDFKGDTSIGYTRVGARQGDYFNVNCPSPLGVVQMKEYDCIWQGASSLLGGKKFVAITGPSNVNPNATGFAWHQMFLHLSPSQANAGTLAHEVGHIYGISQAKNCTTECTNTAGTIHRCTKDKIEGFNAELVSLGDDGSGNKSFTEGSDIESLMYCSTQPISKRWVDPSDYDDLLAGAYSRPEAGGPYLVVTGVYTPAAGTGAFTSVFLQEAANPSDPGTTLTVELLNAGGGVITSAQVGLGGSPHLAADPNDPQMFSVSLPWDANAKTLRLKSGASVLATLARSTASPVPTFTSPPAGTSFSGTVTISWSVTDSDSTTLASQLQVSTDGGTTFTPLGTLSTQSSLTLDTTALASAPNQLFRILATDGFNTSYAMRSHNVVNPLKVVGTVPADGTTGVDPSSAITVLFGTNVSTATLFSGLTFTETGSPALIPSVVSYDSSTKTATIRPKAPLRRGISHTLKLFSTVADVYGNAIGTNFQTSFTTALDSQGPAVLATSPGAGDLHVPLNPVVAAVFDEDLAPATVTSSSVQLLGPGATPVAGTVSYNALGLQTVFVPTASLAAETTYTAKVTTLITDPLGNPLAADREWSFTTGSTASAQPLRIIGNYLDVPRDNDLDGKYDALDLWTDVEVRANAQYNLNGRLDTSAGDLIEWQSAGFFTLPPGVYSIPLSFSGSSVRNSGANGPYLLNALNFYATSDPTVMADSRSNAFATSAYDLADFYSVMTLSGLPDQLVEKGTTRNDAFNLRSFSTHQSQPVSTLTYSIFSNTDPTVGASIDAGANVDINPGAGVEAESDVTIEAKDTIGNRVLSSFHVGVQAAKPSVLTGVQAPKRMAPSTTQTIGFDVFDQFARLYVTPTLVSFQSTQGSVDPPSAMTTNGRAGTGLTVPAGPTTLFLTASAGGASSQIPIDVNKIGDVNGDSAVDVFDTVVMSNEIVGNVPIGVPPFLGVFSSGDFDGNGIIDLFDLVRLANCIVGNGC